VDRRSFVRRAGAFTALLAVNPLAALEYPPALEPAAGWLPLGTLLELQPGAPLPAGFLFCDGSPLDADSYPALAALLSGFYGCRPARLPDLRARVLHDGSGWSSRAPMIKAEL
jgi:hypothetical protein